MADPISDAFHKMRIAELEARDGGPQPHHAQTAALMAQNDVAQYNARRLTAYGKREAALEKKWAKKDSEWHAKWEGAHKSLQEVQGTLPLVSLFTLVAMTIVVRAPGAVRRWINRHDDEQDLSKANPALTPA